MNDYITNIRKKVGHDTIILCGACVIVFKDNKFLLQRRKDNNLWSFHGGCIEMNEKVEDAAKRELFEETGLTADELTFFNVFSGKDMNYTYPNGDKVNLIIIAYVCNKFHGEPLTETDETTDLRWFDINDVPREFNPIDKIILDRFIIKKNLAICLVLTTII